MTIVSCVYVPEGIAMAADSRLTNTAVLPDGAHVSYTFSDNAQKIMLIQNSKIGLVFAGTAFVDGKTIADHIREFDINIVRDGYNISHIAMLLHEFINERNLNVVIMLSGYEEDQPHVYEIIQSEWKRLNKKDENIIYAVSWAGELALANKILQENEIPFDILPLKDAVDLAHFVVDVTKKYTRFENRISTVGGPIDVLVITKDYTKFIKHKILSP